MATSELPEYVVVAVDLACRFNSGGILRIIFSLLMTELFCYLIQESVDASRAFPGCRWPLPQSAASQALCLETGCALRNVHGGAQVDDSVAALTPQPRGSRPRCSVIRHVGGSLWRPPFLRPACCGCVLAGDDGGWAGARRWQGDEVGRRRGRSSGASSPPCGRSPLQSGPCMTCAGCAFPRCQLEARCWPLASALRWAAWSLRRAGFPQQSLDVTTP